MHRAVLLPGMSPDVVHLPDRRRFEIRAGEATAVLTYELADGAVTFTHTVVPAALEGRGLGSRLAAAGVGWARDQGLEVVPQCQFVRDWLDRQARRPG